MSELNERIQEGIENIGQAGVRYETVDLSSTNYTPACPFRAIYVGGAGNVIITGLDGVAATLVGVATGTLLPFAGSAITRTGTTATNLVSIR